MTKIEIELLKASYPIEEVIGKTVKLERKGINYIGRCPFHEDHHPSLVVNPQKQTFRCFACGEHGDVIEFIEKTEHCNFMEAVGKLKIENGEYTNRICLLLDGDKPGREAARKISLLLNPHSVEVQTIFLPEGEDPDSLFRRSGKEAFVSLIDKFLSKPHLSEEMLLTACLLFPETLYMFKGSSCLFTELVKSILQTDDLLFENKENRMILEHLGTGNPEPGLTPALKSIANELHAEYDQLVYNEKEQFGLLYPEASNILNIYLTRLLFLYLENRILQEIQKSVHRLLETDPKKKEIRLDILVNIAKRREQLRHVSENLDRPGAVWG